MYPCPCGWFGDTHKECTDSLAQVLRYQNRISGPLLDRIDTHVQVPRVVYDKLSWNRLGESSAQIRERVERARDNRRHRARSDRSIEGIGGGRLSTRDAAMARTRRSRSFGNNGSRRSATLSRGSASLNNVRLICGNGSASLGHSRRALIERDHEELLHAKKRAGLSEKPTRFSYATIPPRC